MSRHSKLKKQRKIAEGLITPKSRSTQQTSKVTNLNEAEKAELRQMGWSEDKIAATDRFINHIQGKEVQWRQEKAVAQQWVDGGGKGALPLPNLPQVKAHDAEIRQHLMTLLKLSLQSDFEDAGREPFTGENLEQVRAIGEDLNRWGGMALMQAVSDRIPSYDHRDIDYAWDGIGQWRC